VKGWRSGLPRRDHSAIAGIALYWHKHKTRTKIGGRLAPRKPEFAGWLDEALGVVYALEAARVTQSDTNIKG